MRPFGDVQRSLVAVVTAGQICMVVDVLDVRGYSLVLFNFHHKRFTLDLRSYIAEFKSLDASARRLFKLMGGEAAREYYLNTFREDNPKSSITTLEELEELNIKVDAAPNAKKTLEDAIIQVRNMQTWDDVFSAFPESKSMKLLHRGFENLN